MNETEQEDNNDTEGGQLKEMKWVQFGQGHLKTRDRTSWRVSAANIPWRNGTTVSSKVSQFMHKIFNMCANKFSKIFCV